MARNVSGNINFYLKLLQCFGSLIAIFYQNGSYLWVLNGWSVISSFMVIAYAYEQPNFGLEVTLIALYCLPMKDALWDFSENNLGPAAIAILMLIDLTCLVMKRYN